MSEQKRQPALCKQQKNDEDMQVQASGESQTSARNVFKWGWGAHEIGHAPDVKDGFDGKPPEQITFCR